MGANVDVAVGVHACSRFVDDRHRQDVVTRFAAEGLSRGERVAVFLRRGSAPALDPDAGFGPAFASGQLSVAVADDAYFDDGVFDGPRRAAEFVEFAEATVAAGYPALRVYADNGWMPAALPDPGVWLDYELRVARTIPRHQLVGLCGFHADDPPGLPPEVLHAVHAQTVAAEEDPWGFRLHGTHDGRLVLAGDVERLTIDTLWQVLDAGRAALAETELSLAEVEFVDAAGAWELHRLVTSEPTRVVDVPANVRRVWNLLRLTAAA